MNVAAMKDVIADNKDRIATYKIQTKALREAIEPLQEQLDTLARDMMRLNVLNDAIKRNLK